jgi:hypothetical protein
LRVFLGTDPTNGGPMQIHRTVEARNPTEAQPQLKAWRQVLEEDATPVLVTGATVTVRI